MKTVDFKCDIGNEVRVIGYDNAVGHIDEMCWCRQGDMYRVIWRADGKRLDKWMFSWEIKVSSNAPREAGAVAPSLHADVRDGDQP